MKKIICLLALLGLASASVQAATFNFGDYADGLNTNGSTFSNSLGNTGLGEFGYESYSVTNDGVTLTATGSSSDDPTAFAYMDGSWRNRAGLGVCKNLTDTNQCNPSSDDNITANETLKLAFNTNVSLDSMRFVNGEHYTNFTGDFQLRINEDDAQVYDIALAEYPYLDMIFTGHTFEFISLADPLKKLNETEFYINSLTVSTVPVPAAAWLFGSALLGFFGFSRRKANA